MTDQDYVLTIKQTNIIQITEIRGQKNFKIIQFYKMHMQNTILKKSRVKIN